MARQILDEVSTEMAIPQLEIEIRVTVSEEELLTDMAGSTKITSTLGLGISIWVRRAVRRT